MNGRKHVAKGGSAVRLVDCGSKTCWRRYIPHAGWDFTSSQWCYWLRITTSSTQPCREKIPSTGPLSGSATPRSPMRTNPTPAPRRQPHLILPRPPKPQAPSADPRPAEPNLYNQFGSSRSPSAERRRIGQALKGQAQEPRAAPTTGATSRSKRRANLEVNAGSVVESGSNK